MRNASALRGHLLAFLSTLVLCACNHPPVGEVAAAESLLEQARNEGAPTFAPERWREAEEALNTAKARLQERDYRGAISSASEAAERSRTAGEAAAAGKAAARQKVEADLAEVEAVLGELASLREEAARAKVPETAFAQVGAAAESVERGRQEIRSQAQRGDLLAAEGAAEELKARASPLPTAFRQARVRWEAAHAKSANRRKR